MSKMTDLIAAVDKVDPDAAAFIGRLNMRQGDISMDAWLAQRKACTFSSRCFNRLPSTNLIMCFIWKDTPQGGRYWNNIQIQIE